MHGYTFPRFFPTENFVMYKKKQYFCGPNVKFQIFTIMKTKLFLLSLMAISLFFSSCGYSPQSVDPEQEKAIVNVMFQCLSLSPNESDLKMKELGLKRAAHDVFPPAMYMYNSYTNIDPNTDYNYIDKLMVGIMFTDSVVDQISYSCCLNNDGNPASHYKLLSDQVSSFGYTDWYGYYEDSTSEENIARAIEGDSPATAQIAKDRKDLCKHVQNECLRDSNTVQYYAETFFYTHTDGSDWSGLIIVFSSIRSDKEEGSSVKTKDINLAFSLKRIQ